MVEILVHIPPHKGKVVERKIVCLKVVIVSLDRAWTGTADTSAIIKYYISKKRSSEGDPLRSLLRALEACTDDFCTVMICRLIQDFISVGSAKARHKRHRRLIKADATSALLRTLRYRLKDVAQRHNVKSDEISCLAHHSDDTIAGLVLAVGAKGTYSYKPFILLFLLTCFSYVFCTGFVLKCLTTEAHCHLVFFLYQLSFSIKSSKSGKCYCGVTS
ncbi:hypothetical protein ANCCAN_13045 [Ancylostoma caninum]|uniref:Uncharacterized protein n=1 Tax=Ancylostoma caninum TaxID=29170 RepID=A0A368GBH3_ANCCA|nr:hypothetical protein ANCCAN_13045 [Ancylostoma caninum]